VGFDGLLVGTGVGVGALVGLGVGCRDGLRVGAAVGIGVGCNDGSFAKMLNRGW
jgi:hypothetical protein